MSADAANLMTGTALVTNPMDGQPVRPLPEYEGVTREQFEAVVRPAGEPCVLRGLAEHWPAVAVGKTANARAMADYLLRYDTGAPVDVMIGERAEGGRFFYTPGIDGFNFRRKKAPARVALDTMLRFADGDVPHLYAGATSANDIFAGFGEDNTLDLVPPGTPPLAWMGNPSRIAPHYDISVNVAVCVMGRRQFMLFPPDQVGNLYIGPWEVTPAGPECSFVDIREPDLDAHPRYAKARANALLADLHPGDAVFIPPLWWHTVEARGDFNLLVNYWWKEEGTNALGMAAMAHAMLAIRDLPQSQKDGWRAFFDHYVFGEDAQAAADHIPKRSRGVRGPRSAQRDARIRQFIASML